MGCLFSLPNNTQQPQAKTILAEELNSEFRDKQLNQYWPSDLEIERLRPTRSNYLSEVSLRSKCLDAMTKDASYRSGWRSTPAISQESCEARPDHEYLPRQPSTSCLSADERLSTTYSHIYHRRIPSKLSEPRTEHSYLIRHNDSSCVVTAGKPRDMSSLLAATKKKSTLTRTFKRPGVNSQKPVCSDSETNLSDIPSETGDDQPHILLRKSRDTLSILVPSKKKPTHLRTLRRSRKSLQKPLSSDSEINWSDIPSETIEEQPQSRYVLRPSVHQLWLSSPRSQFAPQHAIDESGTHSPPSLRINDNTSGWTDLPQKTKRLSTIWPLVPSGCLTSGSVKLVDSDGELQNEWPEKCDTLCEGPTIYDQISQHLAPLMNEDGHTSQYVTGGSDNLSACRSLCKSQTIRSHSQRYLGGGANSSPSQIDDFSLHSKEHGGNIIICSQ